MKPTMCNGCRRKICCVKEIFADVEEAYKNTFHPDEELCFTEMLRVIKKKYGVE